MCSSNNLLLTHTCMYIYVSSTQINFALTHALKTCIYIHDPLEQLVLQSKFIKNKYFIIYNTFIKYKTFTK